MQAQGQVLAPELVPEQEQALVLVEEQVLAPELELVLEQGQEQVLVLAQELE